MVATVAWVLLSLGASPLSASAATDAPLASPTPAPVPAPAPTAAQALTITSPTPGQLVTRASVPVSGTGAPGAQVQVFYRGQEEPSCIASVASDSSWSCPSSVALVSGARQSIEARVADASGAGARAAVTIDAITPPTVLGPAQTNGRVTGADGYPNATVTVTVTGGDRSCLVKADNAGRWTCFLTLPTGSYSVTATQRAAFAPSPSGPSAPLTLHVDADAPAAPVVTSPPSGAIQTAHDRVSFLGTGEDGATVTVYVRTRSSGSVLACTADVHGRDWACTGPALPAGDYVIAALQTDAVGNTSAASPAVSITVGAPATAPSAASPSSPSSPPAQAAPGAAPPGAPEAPSASPSSPQGPMTAAPAPGAPPPTGGAAPPTGPAARWLTSAPFASTVAPTLAPAAFPGWVRSLLLAAVAVLLLALPARLLAGTLARGRAVGARARLFGRNRPLAVPVEDETGEASASPRWLAVGTLLIATAAIVTLSSTASDQSAYLRLLAAAAVAVALVNAAWGLIGMRAARHLVGRAVSLIFAPRALVIVAACALLSRAAGLNPALLFGLVVGVAAGGTASGLARGRLAAVQLAGLSLLGVLAWMLTTALPTASGPFSAFAAEVTNAVAIVSVGSAAVSLLPIGRLAGRAVFAWSRPIWLGLSLAVGTVFFALLVPVGALWSAGSGGILLGAASLGFAALSVALWLWVRYIEPAR